MTQTQEGKPRTNPVLRPAAGGHSAWGEHIWEMLSFKAVGHIACKPSLVKLQPLRSSGTTNQRTASSVPNASCANRGSVFFGSQKPHDDVLILVFQLRKSKQLVATRGQKPAPWYQRPLLSAEVCRHHQPLPESGWSSKEATSSVVRV